MAGFGVDGDPGRSDGTGTDARTVIEAVLANGSGATELPGPGAVAAEVCDVIAAGCEQLDPVVAAFRGVTVADQYPTRFVDGDPERSVSTELSRRVSPTPEEGQQVALR